MVEWRPPSHPIYEDASCQVTLYLEPSWTRREVVSPSMHMVRAHNSRTEHDVSQMTVRCASRRTNKRLTCCCPLVSAASPATACWCYRLRLFRSMRPPASHLRRVALSAPTSVMNAPPTNSAILLWHLVFLGAQHALVGSLGAQCGFDNGRRSGRSPLRRWSKVAR